MFQLKDTILHGSAESAEILKLTPKEKEQYHMQPTSSSHLDGQEQLQSLDAESSVVFMLVTVSNEEVKAIAQLMYQRSKVTQLIKKRGQNQLHFMSLLLSLKQILKNLKVMTKKQIEGFSTFQIGTYWSLYIMDLIL